MYSGITIPVEDVAACAGCIVATNAAESNKNANIPAKIVLEFKSLKLIANKFLYYKSETDNKDESVFSF